MEMGIVTILIIVAICVGDEGSSPHLPITRILRVGIVAADARRLCMMTGRAPIARRRMRCNRGHVSASVLRGPVRQLASDFSAAALLTSLNWLG